VWGPRRDSNAQPEASEAPALLRLSYVDEMVRAAGFEPATTAVRERGSGRTELHPVKSLGHPAGFEPAASGSANRRSAPLSYGWCLALSAGFEPAIAGLRDRSPGPLDDDSMLAPLAGIEPASMLLNRQPRAPCSPEGNETGGAPG